MNKNQYDAACAIDPNWEKNNVSKVELTYIPSEQNIPDPFTKPLSKVKWGNLRDFF